MSGEALQEEERSEGGSSSDLSASSDEPSSSSIASSSSEADTNEHSDDDEHEVDEQAGAATDGTNLPVSLRDRISAFLPQLAQANTQLLLHTNDTQGGSAESGRSSGFKIVSLDNNERRNISDNEEESESEEEAGPYIEMNLGLGVLEERKTVVKDGIVISREGGSSTPSSSSSVEEPKESDRGSKDSQHAEMERREDDDEEISGDDSARNIRQKRKTKVLEETDVLGKLMGIQPRNQSPPPKRTKRGKGPVIVEVDD